MRSDLSDDIFHLSFYSQLLPLQVQVLHNILQHIGTPKKCYNNEFTRLAVGLLDCLIRRRTVNLWYIIFCHMLTTPVVTNRLLPYGSIITKILRYFKVLVSELVFVETKKLRGEGYNRYMIS